MMSGDTEVGVAENCPVLASAYAYSKKLHKVYPRLEAVMLGASSLSGIWSARNPRKLFNIY